MKVSKKGYFDTHNKVHRPYTKEVWTMAAVINGATMGATADECRKSCGENDISSRLSKISNKTGIAFRKIKRLVVVSADYSVMMTAWIPDGIHAFQKSIAFIREEGADFGVLGVDVKAALESFRQSSCHQIDLELDD